MTTVSDGVGDWSVAQRGAGACSAPSKSATVFREDSGMTTHTTGTGSAPGFEANGVHGGVELCRSDLLAEKISRAAALRTDCGLLSR